jgi:DNA-directed RNA polymerase sigma subunit (sigma70/sigma32)
VSRVSGAHRAGVQRRLVLDEFPDRDHERSWEQEPRHAVGHPRTRRHSPDHTRRAAAHRCGRDMRWIVRDGQRAKDNLVQTNLRLVV